MNSPEDGGTVALSAAAGGGIRDDMFFVGIQIQNRWTWAMFDMIASMNLVSTKFFSQLFHQPDLRPPGAMRIVAGNGAALDLRGWTTLIVSIDGHWLIHEFGVVGDMPLDAVCGSELMKSHAVVLKYLPDGPNELELSNPSCALCETGRAEFLKAQSPQLKFMEPIPKFARLRPRDLHEAPIMASCSKLSAEISPVDIYSVRGAKIISTDALEVSSYVGSRSLMSELSEAGIALQKVLSELKVSELPIPKEDIRRMVELV